MKAPLLILALLTLTLPPAILRADIIELTDGRKFTGTMVRTGDMMTIKSDDGKIITAKPGDIAKVTLTSNVTPEEAAANDWSRLQMQVKAADELQVVIDQYKSFLDKYPAAKQADEARSTMAAYQALTKSDPVKFRGRWMPRAQVEVVIKEWADAARPALELYKAGRLKEALDAARTIITADAQNPDAQNLAGLAAYRTNNLPLARTYFMNLAAADPGSLAAENNLAVISTGQKQVGEAFVHYLKALQIMPDHRLLLDNIAEALNSYLAGGGDKNGLAYRNLLKAFEPAEARMEEAMAKQGLVRWGSTWVTREEHDRLMKAQADLRDQMARLDAQYAAARNTLATLNNQIKQAAADADNYAQIVNSYTAVLLSNQGLALDMSFYAAQRDVAAQNYDRTMRYKDQLQTQYHQLSAGTRDFFAQADRLKAAFAASGPNGQYTGIQRIIDVGETDSPPAPAPVADPGGIPVLQTPPIIATPPAPPTPPVLTPVAQPATQPTAGRGR